MSIAKAFETMVATLPGSETFEVAAADLSARRRLDGIEQMFGFQKGTGRFAGRFAVHVGWRQTILREKSRSDGWDVLHRLSHVAGKGDEWLSSSRTELEESARKAGEQLRAHGIPLLDKYATASALVRAWEKERVPAEFLFGASGDWRHLNLAACLAKLGRTKDAATHFEKAMAYCADDKRSAPYRLARKQRDLLPAAD